MVKIYSEILELFGNDRCAKLKHFMVERNLIPVNIEELPKMDGRNRYLIETEGGTVELSDDSSVGVDITVYVTYNSVRNIFTYMEYLPQPL